jgi:hypothetical protein
LLFRYLVGEILSESPLGNAGGNILQISSR